SMPSRKFHHAESRMNQKFYLLYSEIVQQPVGHDSTHHNSQQENLGQMLFSVPWGHHVVIMDKCQGDIPKAIFYLNKIVEEGWSRSVLLNMIDSQLHLRQGHAVTNFVSTLPDPQSDLARETLRDPYCFDFTQLREPYNERSLKDALIKNVEKFLLELGTGFAYMGREFRLEVGNTELFADMLFYNTTLHCYVVIEVKTTELTSSHIGQLGGYVVAVDRQLCRPGDNKTIGLLICKTQDRILAQYALESSSQPLAVSEYELERFYPQRIEGIIPSVEELERHLEEKTRHHD
ncbi:MAG: PDDEXK nuclease domain-containing protein, partial [Bacteroidales bacterium]|nr:PDDEXK nuclease domain-containing protein [Bacteroidales bacterium]